MTDNIKDDLVSDTLIDELANQFESVWNAGQRIGVDEFLAREVGEDTVDPALRNELCLVEQELREKYLGESIKKIGNYENLVQVGHGAFGEVYRAQEKYLMDRTVAIKVVRGKWAEEKQVIELFKEELKLVGGLSHPNIVQAFTADEIDGQLLLIMEFIEGKSLLQIVESEEKLPVDEALAIIRQVAVGLQYAHERQIIHRDIKPANIMVTKDGVAKILDFGLGKFYGEMLLSELSDSSGPHTRMGTPIGTLDFTPPEQIRDPGNVDIRADIYALGCTFYTIVAGEVPYPDSKFRGFYAKMDAQVRQPPPSFAAAGIEVSAAVEQILQKMCVKEHDQRFTSPQELVEVIDEYLPAKNELENDTQIIKLINQFEAAWDAGQRLGMDEFLARVVGEETVDPALRKELCLVEQELKQKYISESIARIGNYELLEKIGQGSIGDEHRLTEHRHKDTQRLSNTSLG